MNAGDLEPGEVELRGAWVRHGCRTIGDAVCQRIEWLRAERLRKVDVDRSGWDTLYRDPGDGRFWELTYEHSEWHGGGPPTLRVIEREAARAKYEFLR